MVKLIRQAVVVFRMAIGANLGDRAGRFFLGLPDAVVHDKQIQQTVVIVIEPARRNGPRLLPGARVGQSRPLRHVFKSAVASVPVQNVPVDPCDEQVGGAVIIVVAGRHTHGEALAPNPGLHRHVGECAVAFVPVEAVVERGIGFVQLRLAGSVDEVNVGPAVVVIVEDGHARNHRLNLVLIAGCPIAQNKFDSGAGRRVVKCDRVRPGWRRKKPACQGDRGGTCGGAYCQPAASAQATLLTTGAWRPTALSWPRCPNFAWQECPLRQSRSGCSGGLRH